ncbi:MAG: CRISPR-associated endonuclease Cas1 [Caldilineaceae bacterium SB0661_bin_32]|uniref:CRISPR-associated endonuclease Cas1 n=1 Tax=Caldilineaceae bacterium SB0661_bin_32 TaxID=2605255 RepID=A0A6B1D1R6_9CHLR|nr:CRISPR-associated endonuclease Cas1 [Caldilineaceae bacterium SB0661_bin_32]
MLNEYTYCPRLCYMEWVQGEFAHSADTIDGRFQHRRVDRPAGDLPVREPNGEPPGPEEEDAQPEKVHARSVMLSDEGLGAIARIDLVEAEGTRATPVDYKRGTVPDIPGHVYDPERVQLCLQGLLLRANGYVCEEGVIYYVGSKRRVHVGFDDMLVNQTLDLLRRVREMAGGGEIPPPLEDSPKCPRCSLVGICLPDEVSFLKGSRHVVRPDDVRRLMPARDDALPMYVQVQGGMVGKSGDTLTVRVKGKTVAKTRLLDVSSVSIFGNAQVTAQATRELLERGIPICHFTYGGWLKGMTWGMAHKNVELRMNQFRAAGDPRASLAIAKEMMTAKLRNSRVMLRRNHPELPAGALEEIKRLTALVEAADSIGTLLGIEGAAARVYFANFDGMIKSGVSAFDFRTRNRRPPKDPVNAVLSFLYSMLMRQAMVSAAAVGFDPYMGFYHQPRYGRPALALDLAEEFRPLIADSAALTLFNNAELKEKDFIRRGGAVSLTQAGRKAVIGAFERRMDTLITHSLFKYSVSYRRIMEVQARLLGRHLLGELKRYPGFTTR